MINLGGLAGATNSTGDDQKKLDVIGNDIFISAMRSCGRVRILVSEEEDELIEVTPKNIRLRKRVLTANDRKKAARAARVADAS